MPYLGIRRTLPPPYILPSRILGFFAELDQSEQKKSCDFCKCLENLRIIFLDNRFCPYIDVESQILRLSFQKFFEKIISFLVTGLES